MQGPCRSCSRSGCRCGGSGRGAVCSVGAALTIAQQHIVHLHAFDAHAGGVVFAIAGAVYDAILVHELILVSLHALLIAVLIARILWTKTEHARVRPSNRLDQCVL